MKENKTITVYELLGLIKDGKIKEGTYIKYYDRIWENDEKLYVCLKNIINKLDEGAIELNDQVKILEEDKPIIEKIDTTTENTLFTMECYTGIPEKAQDWNFKVLKNKLNEVIDYINRKEDK